MLLTVGEHVLGDLGPRCARVATGFAGGVGDTQQEMCGALSGGVLIIGGLLGRKSLREDDRPALALATRYRERFLAQLGATQCARLRERVVYAPGGMGSCASLVERAAMILLELLMEADGGI
ncbi:MAG TPA: C_GCAxxG_C_C family protein [Chloroflexi bacterium]|nr:C_GCAxxG_C_C family protein [Chloroflexota bacterium]